MSLLGARLGFAQENKPALVRVYTDAQAKRGEDTYVAICPVCHQLDLKGGEFAPALTGSAFVTRLSSRPLGEFFSDLQLRMPLNSPGGLTSQQNADILAHILSVNQFPAGKSELEQRAEVLKQIRIEPAKQ